MAAHSSVASWTNVMIRPEQPGDRDAVRALNERAFGGREEADIVEALHRAQAAVVALVAERGGHVVGHVLFSPVSVDGANATRLVGLAPMAVAPEHQRQGLGTNWFTRDSRSANPPASAVSSCSAMRSTSHALASCRRRSLVCGASTMCQLTSSWRSSSSRGRSATSPGWCDITRRLGRSDDRALRTFPLSVPAPACRFA